MRLFSQQLRLPAGIRNVFSNLYAVLKHFALIWRAQSLVFSEPIYRPQLGFKFAGPNFMLRDDFETQERQYFADVLGHFDYFVNVGANVGLYTLAALKAGLSVVAVEPNSQNARALLKNVQANGWGERLIFFQAAAADRAGIMQMYGSGTGASLLAGWNGGLATGLVPLHRLDHILSKQMVSGKILFLVDVEGAELACLEGLGDLINQFIFCAFFIEIDFKGQHLKGSVGALEEHRSRCAQVVQLFLSAGFNGFCINNALAPIIDFDPSLLSGETSFEGHNFVFLSPGLCLEDVGLLANVELA